MSRTPQARLNRRPYRAGADWRDYRLTAHFTLGEFFTHPIGAPSWQLMDACRELALSVLEPVRDSYGPGLIVSGHRTAEQNAQVGGAPNSWHLYERHPGEAGVDIVFRRGTPPQWAAAASGTPAGGIGTYARHVHLDSRHERVTWSSGAS